MPPRRLRLLARCFFFNDTATTEIYTLSLHDALPICRLARRDELGFSALPIADVTDRRGDQDLVAVLDRAQADLDREFPDRKSTRLNSSHDQISYAVFCLKKKTRKNKILTNNLYYQT